MYSGMAFHKDYILGALEPADKSDKAFGLELRKAQAYFRDRQSDTVDFHW